MNAHLVSEKKMAQAIRQSFWEDYVRQTAKAIAVSNVFMPVDICVNRAVELADKVEEAILKKFPNRITQAPPDPLDEEERVRHHS